jgi:hypothetical protein
VPPIEEKGYHYLMQSLKEIGRLDELMCEKYGRK